MSYNASPTIVAWSCQMIHHIPSMGWTYHFMHQLMSMGFTFYMIHHLLSCHILLHLPSMHVNIIWCLVMSCDTSPTIDARSCQMIHHIPSMGWTYHIMHQLMSMGFTFYMIHHLSSCHILLHLPSMHGHVLWYITYHRCTAISFDTSPPIDAR
jgi:hypothetical protein